MKTKKLYSVVIITLAMLGFTITISAEPYDKEELKPKINGQLFFPQLNLENPQKCRDSVDLGAMKNAQWAICDKIELENLDITLNSQYQLLRRSLKKGPKDALTEAQKTWLKYREQWCRFEQVGPSQGSMGEASYTSCLLDVTNKQIARIKELAH